MQESLDCLQRHDFDLVIAEAAPRRKQSLELFKKLGSRWRYIPVILTEDGQQQVVDVSNFSHIVVVNVIKTSLDLDSFHCAIRRALKVKPSLRELHAMTPARISFGEFVQRSSMPPSEERMSSLLREIRTVLTEEIVD